MTFRCLFLLLVGLLAHTVQAQQFTAHGTVTYETFVAGDRQSGSEYGFEFSFDNGRYFIGLNPTDSNLPDIRFGFEAGALYRIQHVLHPSPGAVNDFAGNVQAREWPQDDGTGANVIWLALGSFKPMAALAASTNRTFPPFWPLDDFYLAKEGFRMPVRLSLLAGGLPQQLVFLNDGTNRHSDLNGVRHVDRYTGRLADGYTNALYDVGQTMAYKGLTLPSIAALTRYYPIGQDSLAIRSVYTIKVSKVGPLAIKTFLPVFSGRAFTIDDRFPIVVGSRTNSLHYAHTNGFWPQGNALNRIYYQQLRQYGVFP